MHDIKAIRENPDAFINALGRRGIDAKAIADKLIALDEKRRAAILAAEQGLARRNAATR
jgi:seryl-tRNA synthetase